jgi:hypothetical protein
MVQPGGRRLNPSQPTLCDHPIPIDGDFGMTDEVVGLMDCLGDPFLAGVDPVRLGHGI